MKFKKNIAADIDALMHPARAFRHPMDVVRDDDLTLYEKRAILSSWASDACTVEVVSKLGQLSDGAIVKFDDIMDALRYLDREFERRVGAENHQRRDRSGSSPPGGVARRPKATTSRTRAASRGNVNVSRT